MSATGDRAAGFTLLETLAAVGVMAVVGALAFPVMERAMRAAQFTEAGQTLQSDLVVARAAAVRTGQAVSFARANDGRGYGWSLGAARTLPAGVVLEQRSAIVFYPDGSALAGELSLQSAERRLRLSVSSIGGTGPAVPGRLS
jgi:type II secretory pathway pseudopilin PulG